MKNATAPETGTSTPVPSRFLSTFLCGPLGVMGAALVSLSIRLPTLYQQGLGDYPDILRAFEREGVAALANYVSFATGLAGALLLLASLFGLLRKSSRSLRLLRRSYVLSYLLFLFCAYVVYKATGIVSKEEIEIRGEKFDAVLTFYARWDLLSPWIAAVALVSVMHVVSLTRGAIFLYTCEYPENPTIGDWILENVRTHGRDPENRKSVLGSTGAHIMVIVIIPGLLRMRGCVDPYRVPHGKGSPVVALVRCCARTRRSTSTFLTSTSRTCSRTSTRRRRRSTWRIRPASTGRWARAARVPAAGRTAWGTSPSGS
jgi:hypothetical protein